jgi:hypothetical protein
MTDAVFSAARPPRSVLVANGPALRQATGYLVQRENACLLVCRGRQDQQKHERGADHGGFGGGDGAAGKAAASAVFGLEPALQAIVGHCAAGSDVGALLPDGQGGQGGVRPLLLAGPTGSGKSVALATLAETCRTLLPAARLVHRVAAGSSVLSLLSGLWRELEPPSTPAPLSEHELVAAVPAMLARAAARLGPVFVLLDGLD